MAEVAESIGNIELRCSLCGEKVLVEDANVLNIWTLHFDCYRIVIARLNIFEGPLLLPQELQFQVWTACLADPNLI